MKAHFQDLCEIFQVTDLSYEKNTRRLKKSNSNFKR